jgi:sugar lactone lactonase YvrE
MVGNGRCGFSDGEGRATRAKLSFHPGGLAFDAAGDLFIADTGNQRIREVTPDGRIATVAGDGRRGYSGDGGPAFRARLRGPADVARDRQGNLFIADANNHCIRKVSSNGVISTVAGTGRPGFAGDGSLGTKARLFFPSGIAVDARGNLFIADTMNHRIRKVDRSGVIRTIAGAGAAGIVGVGGPAREADLNRPRDVAVSRFGDIFIADTGNHRVCQIDARGDLYVVAGCVWGASADEALSESGPKKAVNRLSAPVSVATDSKGNLYAADLGGDRVWRIPVAETAALTDRRVEHLAIPSPSGLALDAQDDLYVTEGRRYRIEKILGAAPSR